MDTTLFDPSCVRCERLTAFLAEVRLEHPSYHCAPVPSLGEVGAPLLVVGLAPGKHGANATGRPFTGDYCGELLYRTLHRFGFCDRPESISADDGLALIDCRVVNAVKCLPPDNKPIGAEINNCNGYLAAELEVQGPSGMLVALGGVAHRAIVRALGERQASFPFGHAREHRIGGRLLIDSYHCSRYNTQTGRLTSAMFEQVFERARELVNGAGERRS
ncbi:MAG: uracil-DNA glycosylase [Pseudomonadota bacterium]